jgi:hypothetical protein
VSPSSTLLGTSSSCRRLAYGTWYVLAALFLLGQFAFLGWVGPGPIFVSWSALAVPTLAATLIWLRRSGVHAPRRPLIVGGVTWLALATIAVVVPFTELSGWAAWTSFLGMLLFPIGLTYGVLAIIDERTSSRGTA